MSEGRPYPETRQICVICGQPWEEHLGATLFRLQMEGAEDWPSPEELETKVSYLECIHLLKVAQRGPAGPQGPTGPMGASA